MAAAAALQRSAVSFRRQGSSGLVWDDRFLSGELAQVRKSDAARADMESREPRSPPPPPQPQTAVGAVASTVRKERAKCTEDSCAATKPSPAPKRPNSRPSRESPTCGFCGIFCGHHPTSKVRKY